MHVAAVKLKLGKANINILKSHFYYKMLCAQTLARAISLLQQVTVIVRNKTNFDKTQGTQTLKS